MPDRDHDKAMAAVFQADPTYAAALQSSVEADGVPEELAIVRRQISCTKKPPLEGRFVCAAPIGGGCRRVAESVDKMIIS
jgi:hypothetical protein